MKKRWLLGFAIILTCRTDTAKGHGRLIEPPSRASMWRYGFDTPPDYNDHESYCGGFSRQWQRNGGKCGICGDAWDLPKPRPHEAGGKYGKGVIVRKYRKESTINLRVELTANHKGYFEFRLCPNNAPHKVATQECLDLYLLKLAKNHRGEIYGDESAVAHDHRFYPGPGSKTFETRYRLPENLTCTQCVLQWRYIAGNNWGTCPNGTGQVGCGPQEEFRACADIAVVDGTGAADETPFEDEVETGDESGKGEKGIPKTDFEPEGWYFVLLLVCATLLSVLATFFLLYFYFYKKEIVKDWWEKKGLSGVGLDSRREGLGLWHTFKTNKKLKFWKWNDQDPEKEKSSYPLPHPIPPPRSKRTSRV